MILIAHRALVNGPDSERENSESAILECLKNNIDVEIDVWYKDHSWYLGHDRPTYEIDQKFLDKRGLWIHAKNFEAADRLCWLNKFQRKRLVYFWHESDERTLTSNKYWWTYPGRSLGIRSIAVMPESHLGVEDIRSCLRWSCAGICTDYVNILKTS